MPCNQKELKYLPHLNPVMPHKKIMVNTPVIIMTFLRVGSSETRVITMATAITTRSITLNTIPMVTNMENIITTLMAIETSTAWHIDRDSPLIL